ncbi:MAG: hypothetical protein GXP55_16965, partial [Deltaproteobacteria bacterium]|nr:hypothetical protein [Deltaproteobacteria bacterium]
MALLTRLAREPLVHFLVLGAALFGLEAATRERAPDDTRVIVISSDFVRALGRRAEAPEDADREGLVRAFVRDEALYREAKRLGLDQGDVIVRRRLIQKMEFLLRGLADVPAPTDAQLQAFVAAHASLFETPPRVSFDEVFFTDDAAHARAGAALAQLQVDPDTAHPERLGDPRPAGYGARGVTHAQLAARRSPAFADAVFAAPLG